MSIKILNTKESLNRKSIEKVEKTIACKLPDEYKYFLSIHNGGHPEPCYFRIAWSGQEWEENWQTDKIHYFLAVHEGDISNFIEYFKDYKDRIPTDTVPIAYDPGGNLILLGISGENTGKVFFWLQYFESDEDETPDYNNVGFIANSFNEFINTLFDE